MVGTQVPEYTNSTRNNPPSIGAYEDKVVVSAQTFLQGAYSTGLLRHVDVNATWAAVLNANALAQPYNIAAFGNYAGTESVTAGFFTSTVATTDIVDWVLVELRDATTPTIIITRRAAFIREDGLIVDLDGVSPVAFKGFATGNYFIAIRHRNHLGMRTAATQLIDGSAAAPTVYNFSAAQANAYQAGFSNAAQATLAGSKFGMWGGNANSNTTVRFTGLANDAGVILTTLGGIQSAVLSPVYNFSDLNLNGNVRYTGLNNDAGVLLNVLGGIQSAVLNQHL